MPPLVSIKLNFPRPELKKHGWHMSRTASSMLPATWTPILSDPTQVRAKPGTLPQDLWREPNTGVIMLRPNPLRASFWEDTSFRDTVLDALKWDYEENMDDHTSAGTWGILSVASGTDRPGPMVTRRASGVSALVGIVARLAVFSILSEIESDMAFAMQTKDTLFENEGYSVWVHPPGTFTDRATDYMVIAFGGRYALHLRMNGTAALLANTGTETQPKWSEKTTFKYSGGGVDHNKPFQITVIPWGFSYISFLFSQSSEPEFHTKANLSGGNTSSFLYDILKYEDPNVVFYNKTTNQWVKTLAAPISVALRRYLFQYGFAWARVRYPRTATLTTVPERLPQAIESDPVVQTRGLAGQIGETATTLTTSIFNHRRQNWNKNTDIQLVVQYSFGSSYNRVYTPELWSVDVDVPETTWTPPFTPVDVSNRWSFVRFQRTVEPDVSRAEIKLQEGLRNGDNADFFDKIMRVGGPIRISYDGVPVFDGYVDQKQPTLTDSRVVQVTQYQARDIWLKLNEKRIDNYKFLDGLNILQVIKEMLLMCGIPSSYIEVSDPNGYISSLKFEGFQDANEQKAINQDGSVGDVLRVILNTYGINPIRVRNVGDKVKIYTAPRYTSTPTKMLYLVSEGTDIELMSDADRFAVDKLKATSSPEITVREPEFNSLICRASDAATDGAQGMQSSIMAKKADPRSIEDPNYFWFIGREKVKIVTIPEMTMASTQGELDKICRTYWERNHRIRPVLEIVGEWKPSWDVDEFVWVVGLNPDGDQVSYGAWRIESINVEMNHDRSTTPQLWAARCNYTMSFVGKASSNDFPMFTTDDNLPI